MAVDCNDGSSAPAHDPKNVALENGSASTSATAARATASSPTTPGKDRPANLPPGAAHRSASTTAVVLHAQQPSDVALLKDVLGPWVATGVNKSGQAHIVDIYSADPEELTSGFQATVSSDGKRAWYFLSEIHPKSKAPNARGGHKARAVVAEAAGCWRSEAGAKKIFDPDSGRLLGYYQKLSFVRSCGDGTRVRTGWVMAEFRLREEEGDAGSKVLGKVYKSKHRQHVAWGGAAKKSAASTFGGNDGVTRAAASPCETEVAASVPKPARKRTAAEEDESAPAPKRAAISTAPWLQYCPQCGFHLGAL